jgi:hypothetical protein
MKSSNLAWRMEREDAGDLADSPRPGQSVRARVEAAAAARRARQRTSFEYRAIVIRDQGLRPFRVR